MLDVLVLISGIYYPVSILPDFIKSISVYSPLTYAIEIARENALHGTPLISMSGQLIPLIAFSLISFIIGLFIYKKVELFVLKHHGLNKK